MAIGLIQRKPVHFGATAYGIFFSERKTIQLGYTFVPSTYMAFFVSFTALDEFLLT